MGKSKMKVFKAKKSGLVALSDVLPKNTKGIDAANIYTMLLYGPEGIGKTTFASCAEKPLFISTEAGTKFVDVFDRPCPDWTMFQQVVAELEKEFKEGKQRFKTVVVDTIDIAYDHCQFYVCEHLGIDHPADEEWGKGYQAIRQEFTRQLARLSGMMTALIFISHEKSAEIRGKLIKTQRTVPTLANSGRRVILPMVDIIGHCGFKLGRDGEPTKERILEFEPSDDVERKDRTGLLPKTLALQYSEFASYMNGTKKKATVKTGNGGLLRMKPRR